MSMLSVRVPAEGHSSVPVEGHASASLKHSRIPWEVTTDALISHAAVRVYLVMAGAERCGRCSIGMRWIADCAHVNVKTVRTSIDALAKYGYIEVTKGSQGKRSEYRLTSAVFGQKERKAAKIVPAADQMELKPARAMVICPQCRQRCGGLLKVGWCRSCNLDRRIDHRIEHAARKAAVA